MTDKAAAVLAEAITRGMGFDSEPDGNMGDAERILAALPTPYRLVRICPKCDGHLDQEGGHMCPK